MASFTPYTYIQCPCHDSRSQDWPGDDAAAVPATGSEELRDANDEDDDDGHTFDPRAPRSTFSLYPLDYLLYCDVCHQIRCPRCVTEELVTVYCPNCLFEVGNTSLKTDGNRCTRSCFQCPICIGPLAVQALESPPQEPALLSADNTTSPVAPGPWVLTCSYCQWNSAEIGVKFDKPQGISGQLQKLRYGDEPSKHVVSSSGDISSTNPNPSSDPTTSATTTTTASTTKARFAALKAFYGAQTLSANPNSAGFSGLGDYGGINSPGTLTRIMSIYSGSNALGGGNAGGGGGGLKKKTKSAPMREAETTSEGFQASDLDQSTAAAIAKLRREGWTGTVTSEQQKQQAYEDERGGARFADELWPIPYLLRTKRSKRCPVCRHIISKPESKVGNTRWRIRLIANNWIPSISVKPLNPLPLPPPPTLPSAPSSRSAAAGVSVSAEYGGLLKPLQPTQFLLKFMNPLFDDVKVTLATPATTPGRFASRVTLLCPEFRIDANPDDNMYVDDALAKDEHLNSSSETERQRQERQQQHGDDPTNSGGSGGGGGGATMHQAEAGKIWDRGRNWVSIVVEVIPASLRIEPPPALLRKEGDPEPDLSPLREDEDILEIPMFVRLEWESDAAQDSVGATAVGRAGDKDAKEKRELAYWCTIGVGRISQK
ncbi:dynactin p62 family-domain-containing protein [Nemania sp. FL0916]|nr:dynactin p62 family-domain-containing protein [Nemania sp. FL0916]